MLMGALQIEDNPHTALMHMQIAGLHKQRKDLKAAREHADIAAKLNPDLVKFHPEMFK